MTNIKELKEFKKALDDYLSEYFALTENLKASDEDYKKFDIKINILGKEFSLSSDADTYNALYEMIVSRINEY
jgi:hypothetical protein